MSAVPWRETGCSRRPAALRTQLAPVPRRIPRATPQRSWQRPAPTAAALRSRRHRVGAGGAAPPQRGQGPAQRGPGRSGRAVRAGGAEGAGEARIATGPAGAEAAGGGPDALHQRGSGAGAQEHHVPRAARARRLPRTHGPAEPGARACAERCTDYNRAHPHPARVAPPRPTLTPLPAADPAPIGQCGAGPAPPRGRARDAAGFPDPGTSSSPPNLGHSQFPGTPHPRHPLRYAPHPTRCLPGHSGVCFHGHDSRYRCVQVCTAACTLTLSTRV